MSLVDLAGEVLVVGQEKLEVNGGLVEEHSGDSWSELVSELALDQAVDGVSDEVVLVLTLERVELGKIDLRQLDDLLTWGLGWVLSLWSWLSVWWLWHSLLLVLTVLLWLLVVVSLASSVASSSTTSLASSASVVVSLALVVVLSLAVAHHLVALVSAAWVHLLHSSELVPQVLSSAEVDDLVDVVDVHVGLLLLEVILGLPEVHLQWLGSKHGRLVVKSDALLGTLDFAVKHVTNLVVDERLSVDLLLVVLQLDGGDLSSLAEFLHQLFFADSLWDELHEKVGSELLSHGLGDWVGHASHLLLTVDVRADEERLVSKLQLQVGSLESLGSISVAGVAHETGSVLLGVHLGRHDLSVWLEELLELISGESSWEVADEEIRELALAGSLSLVSLCVDHHSNFLAALVAAVEGLDGLLSVGCGIKLNVTESSALTCLEHLEFAGLDDSE